MPTANLSEIEDVNTPPTYIAPPVEVPPPSKEAQLRSQYPYVARPEAPPNSASLDDAVTDHDTNLADAQNLLDRYNAGDPGINEEDAGMLKGATKALGDWKKAAEAEYVAADNTPGWIRAGKATAGAIKSIGGKVVDWVKNPTMPDLPDAKTVAKIGALPLFGPAAPAAAAVMFPKPIAEAAQGAVIGAGKMPAVAANLAAGLQNFDPIQMGMETIPGPWQDVAHKKAAMGRGVADVLSHYTNTGANEISRITGISHDTAAAMIGENLTYIALGGPAMNTSEGIAHAVRNATNSVGNIVGGAKWAAAKTAPTAIGAAKAVTIDAALKKLGWASGFDEVLAAMGGFSTKLGKNKTIADNLTKWAFGRTTDEIAELGAVQATKPMGMAKNEALAGLFEQKAKEAREGLELLKAKLKPEDARMVEEIGSGGNFKVGVDDLSPEGQGIRAKFEQIQDLENKAKALRTRNNLQKVYDATIQGVPNFLAHTGMGAAIGAGFAGSMGTTGKSDEAVASGIAIGGLLGGAAAPFSSVQGIRGLRIKDMGAELKDFAIKNDAIAGDMSDLSPAWQQRIYSLAGMTNKLGGRKVFLHPEEDMAQWAGQEAGTEPSSGFTDAQGNIHLNKADLATGVGGHEFTHVTQKFPELFGEMLGKAAPEHMDAFAKEYQDALSATGKQRFNSVKERDAEVGRLVLQHTPIEMFYGGETGGQIVARVFNGLGGKGKTKFINGFNAPYTRADLLAMKQRFYKAGELARMTNGQIAREAKPPDVSFSDYTADQAAKFHRAAEFNMQQGMSPEAAFKDVVDNIEFLPRPKKGQTRGDVIDEAWERYYDQVQHQNAKREAQEWDLNTREKKPKWYEPTTFFEDARMRSLLPEAQKPDYLKKGYVPPPPAPKPFQRTYGWMSPEGKYVENKPGNIHANTIAGKISGQGESFYDWRAEALHKGEDPIIKRHPYVAAMEYAYKKGWEAGWVRLLNAGKTLYANVGKDFVITPEMKEALIKRAEESGADRLMLDRDMGRGEKLWDNPAFAAPPRPPSAYFSGQGAEIRGTVGKAQPADIVRERPNAALGYNDLIGEAQPAAGRNVTPSHPQPHRREAMRQEAQQERAEAEGERPQQAPLPQFQAGPARRVRTYLEHMEDAGRATRPVADMTAHEIRSELTARDAWNAREGWRGKPEVDYLPRRANNQEAIQEAWERYYFTVKQQNEIAETGGKMPSQLALTRRANKKARQLANATAEQAQAILAAEQAHYKARADRWNKQMREDGEPIEAYGWLSPDGEYIHNARGIHADTITKVLNPDLVANYDKMGTWSDKHNSYVGGGKNYSDVYGSMTGAYEAGWGKKYLRLTSTGDTMYVNFPSEYGEISGKQQKALIDKAIEDNMNEIIRDTDSGAKVIWKNPTPVKPKNDYMPRPDDLEAVKENAARLPDGRVVVGNSQEEVFKRVRAMGLDPMELDTGFMTKGGDFKTAGEAYYDSMKSGRGYIQMQPRIKAAAVRDKETGNIFEGKNHIQAKTAWLAGDGKAHDYFKGLPKIETGFVTDEGKWVDRAGATTIAARAGQLSSSDANFYGNNPGAELISEDVNFMPKLKSAAVMDKETGKLYPGENHKVAYDDYLRDNPRKDGKFIPYWDNPNTKEGFITDEGKFVDRLQGKTLARDSGQLRSDMAPKKRLDPYLYSEDIHFRPRDKDVIKQWEKGYDLVEYNREQEAQGKPFVSQRTMTRRKNKIAKLEEAEQERLRQEAVDRVRHEQAKRARRDRRPKEVYGWLDPAYKYIRNEGDDIHAMTISRLLNPEMDAAGQIGKPRTWSSDGDLEHTGLTGYHELYGGMTEAYAEGWDRGFLRLTSLGRQMYVHYPRAYGSIGKAQLGALEKIAMEHNMDSIMWDGEGDDYVTLWTSPDKGKRDDGMTSYYNFNDSDYQPRQRRMNDEGWKSPFFIERHDNVYAIVDRRKPDTVGYITPDLQDANIRKTELDEVHRPKTGASGLWDTGIYVPEHIEEHLQVAQELDVPYDKHFWEQKPDARRKIQEYYDKQGADYMPRKLTPLQVAEGVKMELDNRAEAFIKSTPFVQKFRQDEDGLYSLVNVLSNSVKGKPLPSEIATIQNKMGMTPSEIEVLADGFRNTVNRDEIQQRVEIGSLPAGEYPYDMNPNFEKQMRKTMDSEEWNKQFPDDRNQEGDWWTRDEPPPGWNPKEGGDGFWPREFMPRTEPDAIKQPAIQDVNGEVYTAPVGYHSLIPLPRDAKVRFNKLEMGFVTNKGDFLNRTDALARAQEYKQLAKWVAPEVGKGWSETDVDMALHAPDVENAGVEWQYGDHMPKGKKAIRNAAVRSPDGQMAEGRYHWDAVHKLARKLEEKKGFGYDLAGLEFGFTDNQGRFLTRPQAMQRVVKLGQMPKEIADREIARQTAMGISPDKIGLESVVFQTAREFMPRGAMPRMGVPVNEDMWRANHAPISSEHNPIDQSNYPAPIVSAAILDLKDGTKWVGKDHIEAYRNWNAGQRGQADNSTILDGFIDTNADFVGRRGAGKRVNETGQINAPVLEYVGLDSQTFEGLREFMPRASTQWQNERPLTRRNIAMLLGWPRDEGAKNFNDLSAQQQKDLTKYYMPPASKMQDTFFMPRQEQEDLQQIRDLSNTAEELRMFGDDETAKAADAEINRLYEKNFGKFPAIPDNLFQPRKDKDAKVSERAAALSKETEVAAMVSSLAHQDQKRKFSGEPYATHPVEVASKVRDELKPAALLHDVIEDKPDIKLDKTNVSQETIDTVQVLTRKPDETYAEMIDRVAQDPAAREIKIADLMTNLSDLPSDSTLRGRYVKALDKLKPSDDDARNALSSNKQPLYGEARNLDRGTPVGLRIDIPAFENNGQYVVTIHDQSRIPVGDRIGYDSFAAIDDPVFSVNQRGARKVKEGESNKFAMATALGKYDPRREFPADIGDYTMVGFNPEKHSYFYEKGTNRPVISGDHAISSGNTVFVKNPAYGNPADFDYMPPIRKSEARGNSREVSQEEYDHLAASGKAMLDEMRSNTQSIEGLRANWNDMLNQMYAATRKPWGGGTINPTTGRDIRLTSGKREGPFSLSVKDEGQDTVSIPIDAPQKDFNAAMLIARHRFPQLAGKDHYLGVFRDDDKGTIDIDPVAIVDTPRQVERIGAYTHASGGAYDYATGDGYFPPHLDYMPKTVPEMRKFQKEMAKLFPEAFPTEFQKDKEGNYKVDSKTGEFKPVEHEWAFDKTPLYKKVNDGMEGGSAKGRLVHDPVTNTYKTISREDMDRNFVQAAAQRIAQEFKNKWSNNPDAMKAMGWYTELYHLIAQKFGKENAELFAQLLATTSPGNNAQINFGFALEAMNNYLSGRYDNVLKMFKDSYDAFMKGDLRDAEGNLVVGKGKFNKYLRDNDILAYQNKIDPKTGQPVKLGKFSLDAMYDLAGHFWARKDGKKVIQFVKNISGIDLQNPTIDLWAARTLRRLASEGQDVWRRLPEAEAKVGDRDFDLAQSVYNEAARQLGMNPTDLQAVAWFAEKIHYGKNKWFRGAAGSTLGDYRPLLKAAKPKAGSLSDLEVPKGIKMKSVYKYE